MIQISKPNETPLELIDEKAQKHFKSIITRKSVTDKDYLIYRKVKSDLFKLYNGKCCYCESKLRGTEIDHYRPKNKYYWLAYSWDNLLPVCSTCNKNKGVRFPILGSKAELYNSITVMEAQNLISQYNETEEPVLFNPEVDQIDENLLIFEKDGFIGSENERFKETIKILKLNDTDLLYHRKQIFSKIETRIAEINIDKQIKDIDNEKKKIYLESDKEANNKDSDYLAFRKYIVKHWLRDMLTNP